MKNNLEKKKRILAQQLDCARDLNDLVGRYLVSDMNLNSIDRHGDQNYLMRMLSLVNAMNDDCFAMVKEIKRIEEGEEFMRNDQERIEEEIRNILKNKS